MNKFFVKGLGIIWQIIGVIFSLSVVGLVSVLIQEGYWLQVTLATVAIVVGWYGSRAIQVMYASRKAHKDENHPLELFPKNNPPKTLLVTLSIVTVVLAMGGVFYWFQWRPSQIRSDCDNYARGKYNYYDAYINAYTACLHKEGLQ